jgi:hypothetical protein
MENNNEDLKFNLIKEEGKEINDLIIEERGYVNKFTWQEFQEALKVNLKQKKQIEAQLQLDKTAIENIKTHHSYVEDLTPEQIHAIALYHSYDQSIKQCELKLEEFEKAEKADNERKELILAQIPELNIESPYVKA